MTGASEEQKALDALLARDLPGDTDDQQQGPPPPDHADPVRPRPGWAHYRGVRRVCYHRGLFPASPSTASSSGTGLTPALIREIRRYIKERNLWID